MKRIPFSQVLKTAAIDIRREYDRLYGMFCVQKFQDMVGAGSSLKDYCATYFVRLRFLYKGIIIKHNKTEPTYTKTSLFLCEKRRFFMARTEKGVVATI